MKGGTSQNLSSFYFHNSWIYVEIMTQNVNFPIWPVQYLACQKSQSMYKVTLIVNKGHKVYTYTCVCIFLQKTKYFLILLNFEYFQHLGQHLPRIEAQSPIECRLLLRDEPV